jgi:high affinity Mn2+ porin
MQIYLSLSGFHKRSRLPNKGIGPISSAASVQRAWRRMCRRSKLRLVCLLLLAVLVHDASHELPAADLAVIRKHRRKAAPTFDWSGFYLGVHVGYNRGTTRARLADSPASADLDDPTAAPPFVGSFSNPVGSLYGGVQLGYNHVLPSRLLVGIEADATFPNYLSADDVVWSRVTAVADTAEKIDYLASVRGRIGYAFPYWMIYATGGFAWANGRFLQSPGVTDDPDKVLHLHTGWVAGGGAEFAIAGNWTTRLEYLYYNLGRADAVFPSGTGASSSFDMHAVRLGLNFKPGSSPAGAGARNSDGTSQTRFPNLEIHGQTTFIQQGYPAFRSPYLGENSFTPWAQTRNTWSSGLAINARLWNGAELYYNPELLQGFGLHDTTGAAGFPNGEAQKSNFPYPHYSTSRLYLRQTFGFGGEQETLESGFAQMAGKKDVSRLTLQVGRFTVHDAFDNNALAGDPRLDFLNWSIWAAGAFDYPADKLGVSYGAVAELNQKYWALRIGYYLTGNEPNSNQFDTTLFKRGAYIGEIEARHSWLSREGKLRIGIWADTYFSGSYSESLDLVAANPDLDPTDAIRLTRRGRTKYGYYFNLEQPVTDTVGFFGRWSWNDGKNEISAFTDIDRSLSFGVSISGKAWGRADDKIGIGAAINGLSNDHKDYIAAGGLGILIGDGRLNYSNERILEAYYAMRVMTGTMLTFDYQYMVNPAYNADRGPISFFSGRLRAEF